MTPLIAVAITYHPDSDVITNLLSYYDHVEKFIVVDNSEKDSSAFLSQLQTFDKFIVIKNKRNEGIAVSLNLAAQKARELNFSWLLTMDQDSSFTKTNIQTYLRCFEKKKNDKAGMFGINYINSHEDSSTNECITIRRDSLITSGSILNLSAMEVVGGFNEDLFIDGVDDEICFRLNLAGYDVLEFPAVHLEHNLGKLIEVRNWYVGKKVQRNIHPPIRLYYMTRNYLFLIKKYKQDFPAKAAAYKKELIIKIKNSLLYGKDRSSALKYVFTGLRHYRKQRFGKL